jgi:hypothetical protein
VAAKKTQPQKSGSSAVWLIAMLLIAVLVEGYALINLTLSRRDREDGSYEVLRPNPDTKRKGGAISDKRLSEMEDNVKFLERELENRNQAIKAMEVRLHILERRADDGS